MRIGRENVGYVFIGRSCYDRRIALSWGFGWVPHADLGEVPWRHYGRIRLFYWVPRLILRRHILLDRWQITLPVGICAFGRCWRLP